MWCFRGGSAMMMSYAMQEFDVNKKKIKNFGFMIRFEGMANPSEHDENILSQKAISAKKN